MVDRRELLNDRQEALVMAMDGRISSVWTSLPGIVQSVDYDKRTCSIQPSIQGRQQLKDGSYQFVNLPMLVDCPIILPSVGGFTISLPVKADDEVLVLFASRCIDSWYQNGGVGIPMEFRMHDLSDGFALVGIRSVPNSTPLDEENLSIQSDDAETYIQLTPGGDVKVKATNVEVEAASNVTIKATSVIIDSPAVSTTGNLTVGGNLVTTGEVTIGSIPFSTHKHSTSSNPSGAPI